MCLYNVSARWTVKTDKFSLFVYCNFLVLLSTTVCSQNINKQNVNIGDETLTDYSFLSWYHFTKSKNYLKRRYRIRHWIPMFFGTPCMRKVKKSENLKYIRRHLKATSKKVGKTGEERVSDWDFILLWWIYTWRTPRVLLWQVSCQSCQSLILSLLDLYLRLKLDLTRLVLSKWLPGFKTYP